MTIWWRPFVAFYDLGHTAGNDAAAAGCVSRAQIDSLPYTMPPVGKVRTLDMLQQIIQRSFRMIYLVNGRRRSAHRGCAAGCWWPYRQQYQAGRSIAGWATWPAAPIGSCGGAIVVVAEIDGFFVDVCQQLRRPGEPSWPRCNAWQPADRRPSTEVTLPVDQHVAHSPRLRHADHSIIN